jgi:tetratricopeptide (TPR) repeat protein
MMVTWGAKIGITLAAGLLVLGLASGSHAQGGQGQQPAPNSPNQTPGQPGQTPGQAPAPGGNQAKDGNSLPLDSAPPVNAEEDAAFKAFQGAPNTDALHKISLGEAFEQKYPASRYRPVLYSTLTMLYLQTNQVQKMEEVGDKEVQLTPTDVQTMAILGQTIPRAMGGAKGADAAKELAKAEDYSKRAIEVTPTIAKPANVTDEQFANAKNTTLAMAHSGLGLVYVRRGKYDDAIPELDQSVKIDPEPDPVNYYLLGLANEKASHFQEAVTAYNKCASIQSGMQQTCKNGAEEAKKLGSSQLSVPK